MKQKVYAYLIRRTETGPELLVFDHVDFPEAGTQVPGGTLDPGERPEAAVLRELFEESGVDGARLVRRLGAFPWWAEELAVWHERHLFHLEPTGDLPDGWVHIVSAGEGDKGLRFRCFWIPLAEAKERLIANMGAYWTEEMRAGQRWPALRYLSTSRSVPSASQRRFETPGRSTDRPPPTSARRYPSTTYSITQRPSGL
jgi:8-oxo-dGTP pyrophosphatase MutT (NUDIX family)